MSPLKSLEQLNQVKKTLGDEAYQELSSQIEDVQRHIEDMFERPDVSCRVASVPAAVAAGIVLEKLQNLHPHNPMSGWAIEHQLRAMYAILAFRDAGFFADVYINFASDLEVEHVAHKFR